MGVFYASLFLVYVFSFLSRITREKNYKLVSIVWISFSIAILILVAGLSHGLGDSGMYKHTYNLLVQDPSQARFDRDGGWTLFNLILIQFSTNPQTLLFVAAFINHLCNGIILYKYRSYLELEFYLYIASGYYTVTMNGLRQCLAAALLFICIRFLIQGKFKVYCLLVLIISAIHASALVMIPVYFIVRKEAWSRSVVIFIGLAVIGVVFYSILEPILFELLKGTQYEGYSSFKEGGSSFIRTVVNAVPVILAYLKRDELKKKWPESNIFVNIALINLIFVAFGMFNWIFNRFTLYFQLYNFILIPYLIKNCFVGKEKRLLYFGLIVCYFIFFYREQVVGMGIKYSSDYINANNFFYNIK